MRPAITSLLALTLLAPASRGDTPKGKDAEKKPKKKFTIGKETTYATGPLDKEGYIDYPAALNERLSKGVTPANNACVLIWKALGPHPVGVTMPPEFFKWLGIPQPPEKGDHFLPLNRFLKERRNIDPGQTADEISAQQERAWQRPWKAADYPSIAAWLKDNEKPLAVLLQATKRSHYFSPLTPGYTRKGSKGLINTLLPAVQGSREVAIAFVSRAMLRLGKGDTEGAWQDLLACHRLGRLVGRGGTLIEGLVGIAIDAIASEGDQVWLDRARPDAKRIKQCLDELRKLPPLASFAEKVNLAERFVLLEATLMVARHGIHGLEGPSGRPPKMDNLLTDLFLGQIQWDPALRNVNRWYNRLVAAMQLKDRTARYKELGQIGVDIRAMHAKVKDPANMAKLFFPNKATPETKGRVLGDLLISLMLPAVEKAQRADDRGRQTQDNLTVVFALGWYQREHGHYPKTLDALTPKYLATVPKDRFSGKALDYRPADGGYVLSCMADIDISIRMPAPEPPSK